MAHPIRDKFITIKGLRLNYIKVGDGNKNLLVLPGAAGPVHFYLWIINQRLYSEYTTYFLNPPGFGKSQSAKKPWGIEYANECLDEFVERFQVKRLTILGHSMGGAMAAAYAASRPSKVEKLIMCSPLGFCPYKLTFKKLWGVFQNKFNNPQYRYLLESLVLKYGPWIILRHLTPTMLKTFNIWTSADFLPYFQNIQCQTVVIWGDNDTSTGASFEHFYKSQTVIPHCRTVRAYGSQHSLPITEPKKFQNILIDSLVAA